MFDNSTTSAAAGTLAAPKTSIGNPEMDKEPGWKSEFRQTLSEVMDKGFGSYAEEIRLKKMEELREKILEAMGLTEDDLENMSSEQRQQIEKMIALEMQERLAAEKALDAGNGQDIAADGIDEQIRAAPNGMGTALVLMQALDSEPTPPESDNGK